MTLWQRWRVGTITRSWRTVSCEDQKAAAELANRAIAIATGTDDAVSLVVAGFGWAVLGGLRELAKGGIAGLVAY